MEFSHLAPLQTAIHTLFDTYHKPYFREGGQQKFPGVYLAASLRRLLPDNHNLLHSIRKVHKGSPSVTPDKLHLGYGKGNSHRNSENNLTSTSPSWYHQLKTSFPSLTRTVNSRIRTVASDHLQSWRSSVFTVSKRAKPVGKIMAPKSGFIM